MPLSPYLQSLARQDMVCTDCMSKTYIKESLNPNYAYEMCPNCGLLRTIATPKNARVDPNDKRYKPKIIKFEDIKKNSWH